MSIESVLYVSKLFFSIKVHPSVINLFSNIPQTELEFDCTELPCFVPPLPWLSCATGGYLLNQTDFVRLPTSAGEQEARLRSLPIEKIGGLLDSVNVLNSCPWKLNTDVLDLLIGVFQRGGSRQLSVPVSVNNAQLLESLPLEKVRLERFLSSLFVHFWHRACQLVTVDAVKQF